MVAVIELSVLGAVVVIFKAVFAGEDLDRKVGADVLATVFGGLLKTTSATDPVLLQVADDVKQLKMAPYENAMAAGHRYLDEARLAAPARSERLQLARQQLVDAAAAAQVLQVPLLIANAEFAIAKCDALLASPTHAGMALRRAAAAIEQAIERLDINALAARYRMLIEAKQKQDNSVGEFLTRFGSGLGVIKKGDIEAFDKTAQAAMTSLNQLTELYSQIQTATLASTGHDNVVMWAPPAEGGVLQGLRDKAVTIASGATPVCGYGLTVKAEQRVLWRPEGKLVADVLLSLTAREEGWLDCRAWSGSATPAAISQSAVAARQASTLPSLTNPAGAVSFSVRPGSYRGWVRVPSDFQSIERVEIRLSRMDNGRRKQSGACIRIPTTP